MSKNFPTSRNTLFTYIGVVIPYLTANKTRLQITTSTITALTTLFGDISTVGTYMYYFAKWSDKTGSRTKNVIDRLTEVENQFKVLLTSIYDDIPASVWNSDDRNTLMRKRGAKRPYTRHTAPIIANAFMRHKINGFCNFTVAFYVDEDSSRASINKVAGANAIELAICIVCANPPYSDDVASGKVKQEAVKSASECPYREIHHKARVNLSFRDGYHKSDVYIYARLIDDRHPELAGPWSLPLIVTIP